MNFEGQEKGLLLFDSTKQSIFQPSSFTFKPGVVTTALPKVGTEHGFSITNFGSGFSSLSRACNYL